MSSETPKIYCFVNGRWGSRGVVVLAVAEDGTVVGNHVSSSPTWAQRDIGCVPGGASGGHRADYEARYPDGYDLEWVENPGDHPGVLAALEANRAMHEFDLPADER